VEFDLHLESERVSAANTVDPVIVEPQTSLRNAFELLKERGSGSVLICRNSRLVGIYTERDALRVMAGGDDLDVPIEQVMHADPVTVSTDSTLAEAIKKMSAGGYRRLPVVDEDGAPTGVLTVAGIIRYMVDHFPEAIYNLPPEPNAVTSEREGA